MTDEMLTLDDRPAVRLERRFEQPIEKVWRAITEPEHLARWFPAEVQIDLREGGQMIFSQGGEEVTGEVITLDPPRMISFSWDTDVLRLELTADEAGTRLTFTHFFDDRAGGASFATGWHHCLAALGPVLAGERPAAPSGIASGSSAALSMAAQHEKLIKQFGLDRGDVSKTAEGWTIRFERQLTCPAEIAWNLFLGRDQASGAQRTAPAVGEPLTPYAAPEVVLGTITEIEEPKLLAFDVAADEPGHHVRLEFGPGTGQGARMLLIVTGTTAQQNERDAAYDQWGAGAVEHVAGQALEWAENQVNT